jgi:hypothetical protein
MQEKSHLKEKANFFYKTAVLVVRNLILMILMTGDFGHIGGCRIGWSVFFYFSRIHLTASLKKLPFIIASNFCSTSF